MPGLERQQLEYLGQRAGLMMPVTARPKLPASSPLMEPKAALALALEQSLAHSQLAMQLRKAQQ